MCILKISTLLITRLFSINRLRFTTKIWSDFLICLNKNMADRLNEFVNPQFDSRWRLWTAEQSCFHGNLCKQSCFKHCFITHYTEGRWKGNAIENFLKTAGFLLCIHTNEMKFTQWNQIFFHIISLSSLPSVIFSHKTKLRVASAWDS